MLLFCVFKVKYIKANVVLDNTIMYIMIANKFECRASDSMSENVLNWGRIYNV